MKIKRFDNLWAMGLILFGVLLLSFYVMKIFFPDFIVGVAETPSIVKFGNYVDNHKWAYYLFNGTTSFISLYLYVCAVCKIKKLKLLDCGIILFFIAISYIVEWLIPNQLFTYNVALYFILVLIIGKVDKIKDYEVFYSSCICFLITAFSQSISLEIRGISTLISYPNTATYFILLIDLYIWSMLLYLFFNYKGGKKWVGQEHLGTEKI